MDSQPLADDFAHPHARVERGVGVLEDDLHAAAHVAHLGIAEGEDVPPLEFDAAAGRLDQTQDAAPERRLAAADSPTSPRVSPSSTSSVTPSTARTSPRWRDSRGERIGNRS